MTKEFIRKPTIFPLETELPWNIVDNLCTIISHIIETLDDSYKVKDGVAVHETATIDHNVTIKAPLGILLCRQQLLSAWRCVSCPQSKGWHQLRSEDQRVVNYSLSISKDFFDTHSWLEKR